jgi:hypothetical protein
VGSPDERGDLDRQVVWDDGQGAKRRKVRGEAFINELVDALGTNEVAQAVLAEVS